MELFEVDLELGATGDFRVPDCFADTGASFDGTGIDAAAVAPTALTSEITGFGESEERGETCSDSDL